MSESYHDEPLRYDEEEPKALEPCEVCGIHVMPPRMNNLYCQSCYDHLEQAYKWLHGPLLTKEEKEDLKQRMLDLTDIQKIAFE